MAFSSIDVADAVVVVGGGIGIFGWLVVWRGGDEFFDDAGVGRFVVGDFV